YIFDRHDDIQNISYFSTTNFMITLIKVFLILYLLIPYFEYSDFIINKIAKYLIMKIEIKSGNVEYNGIYNRVSYTKKEWIIYNSDFYSGYKGLLIISIFIIAISVIFIIIKKSVYIFLKMTY
ncbi:hypothetical protein, partial [Streptococcus pneumoniae]|uniref:hypothetical protein n=1 Tax=Streptococcus pneumoniae TaxID=1313 RepID=UPI000776E784